MSPRGRSLDCNGLESVYWADDVNSSHDSIIIESGPSAKLPYTDNKNIKEKRSTQLVIYYYVYCQINLLL